MATKNWIAVTAFLAFVFVLSGVIVVASDQSNKNNLASVNWKKPVQQVDLFDQAIFGSDCPSAPATPCTAGHKRCVEPPNVLNHACVFKCNTAGNGWDVDQECTNNMCDGSSCSGGST